MAVTEVPQKYPKARKYHKDLDRLAAMVKATSPWHARFPPRVWKGGIAKPPHHRRIIEALSEAEREVAKGATHDAMDAIGIGLYALGRVGKGGKP
jgi:hypothetical protein